MKTLQSKLHAQTITEISCSIWNVRESFWSLCVRKLDMFPDSWYPVFWLKSWQKCHTEKLPKGYLHPFNHPLEKWGDMNVVCWLSSSTGCSVYCISRLIKPKYKPLSSLEEVSFFPSTFLFLSTLFFDFSASDKMIKQNGSRVNHFIKECCILLSLGYSCKQKHLV